jgi:hypothetical protein
MHCATVSLNHWVSDLIYTALWNLYGVIHPLGSTSYDRSIDSSRASSSESAIYYCRPRTKDFGRCDCRAAQMKRTVVYEIVPTCEYLILATKRSQHFPLQGRRDCRLTTVCTNERPWKKLVSAHWRLSPPCLSVKPTTSKAISLR